jgi:hypothetical protein
MSVLSSGVGPPRDVADHGRNLAGDGRRHGAGHGALGMIYAGSIGRSLRWRRLGREAERLREGGMRVDCPADVLGVGAHLEPVLCLGDQLAGVDADDPTPITAQRAIVGGLAPFGRRRGYRAVNAVLGEQRPPGAESARPRSVVRTRYSAA